ncbi:CD160 antigen isoform X3 [Ictidomys tridecemlineatus]
MPRPSSTSTAAHQTRAWNRETGLKLRKAPSRGSLCFQELTAKDVGKTVMNFKFPRLLTMWRTLAAPGRGCWALVILLTIVDMPPGGGLHITSSASQHGEQLTLVCTLWHKREEAEGFIVFLCKDRSWNCSSEVSLKQLRPKRDPEVDNVSDKSSQLVYTINRVTPADSGTYQCCARSQKLGLHLQGHFFSVVVTETGNYTVTGPKPRTHPEVSQSGGALSSGLPQEKPWLWLVTSLVAFRAL